MWLYCCIWFLNADFSEILFSPFRNSTHVRIQWVSRRRQRRHFNLRWSIMSSSTQSLETRRMHTGSHTECVNPTWGNLPLMSWNTSLQREQKQLLSTWSHTRTHTYTHKLHTHTLIITLVQTHKCTETNPRGVYSWMDTLMNVCAGLLNAVLVCIRWTHVLWDYTLYAMWRSDEFNLIVILK